MDWLGQGKKITGFLHKYRYVALIVVIGIVLMLIPTRSTQKQEQNLPQQTDKTAVDIGSQLAQILSHVHGAGRVEVLLTVASGETTVYQTDADVSNAENGSSRQDTVIITDSNRGQSGLIQRVDPPVYLGAVIVCQGADSASVRLSIVEAVSKATGLGADKISVLKMK